ncbi:MAG: TIGR03364 family FAD-dependent oxidoreductase [Armatimonadaceae bacterium]
MKNTFDDAVVGAGIIGLAHAYHLAKQGRRVIVFERGFKAQGASVRNFGMLWPIGQPAGAMHALAMRSREIWLNLLQESGIWHEQTGSLHLAYEQDEEAVLQEFIAAAPNAGYAVEWWTPEQVAQSTSSVKQNGLRGAMWSASEVCVDPREVVGKLPAFLSDYYGVTFRFGTTVTGYNRPTVYSSSGEFDAENLYVCSGDDLQTLYPSVFADSGVRRCKLQMMRSAPTDAGWKLGPMLAAGLTLRHYRSFEGCPTLPELRRRFATEAPEYDRYGIHVMASQNGSGELVLGDSHEYDAEIEPFDKDEIDRLVLDYLHGFLNVPRLHIASRWHGIYIKYPEKPFLVAQPEPGVTVTGAVGGAGMTLSFGLVEAVASQNFDERQFS